MIDDIKIRLAFLCFPAKDYDDVVKLGVCSIADLIKVLEAKYGIFMLRVAGHITPRRGPDLTRGPDAVHHVILSVASVN